MTEKVVYLAFKNNSLVDEHQSYTACKHCRNKTFLFVHDEGCSSPMVKCACCGAHIGRVGWSDEGETE